MVVVFLNGVQNRVLQRDMRERGDRNLNGSVVSDIEKVLVKIFCYLLVTDDSRTIFNEKILTLTV